jgi:choline-sulfatase
VLGRLLDTLRASRQLEQTLVIVAADHGESLGEHGERTHGVFVYDVTMRVPWIVWAGARLRSAALDHVTSLVDLAPTALDLLGIPAPPEFTGRPARTADERSAYVEAMDANLTRNWAPLTGIVRGPWKFIELPRPELYDVDRDPSEQSNLFDQDPERARTLGALLRDVMTTLAAKAAGASQTTLGADARQRLQALGYTASSADPGQRVYTDADDPKTLTGPANDLQRAVIQFNAGDRAAAMVAVRAIATAHPRFTTAFGMLADMQRQSGDLRGAIATLDDVVRRGVADPSVMLVLAGYLQEAGEGDRAVALVEAVIAARPDYAEAYNSLGVISMRLGRHDRARAALRKVIELDPTSATAYENLAADKLSVHDLAGAVPDLQRALELDPHLYDALFNLGIALVTLKRDTEARPYLERFVREAPADRYAEDVARIRGMLEGRR